MKEAGLARRRGGNTFPLIGVAAAPELDAGASPWGVDPHHSHLVAVDHPGWPAASGSARRDEQGFWGSETEVMFELFDRLAHGRASVALVINGGALTLEEVARHGASGRRIVVVTGSGRAADALASMVQGTEAAGGDPEAMSEVVRGWICCATVDSSTCFQSPARRSRGRRAGKTSECSQADLKVRLYA